MTIPYFGELTSCIHISLKNLIETGWRVKYTVCPASGAFTTKREPSRLMKTVY